MTNKEGIELLRQARMTSTDNAKGCLSYIFALGKKLITYQNMNKKLSAVILGVGLSCAVFAQNGPRNNMKNFPEAVPTNTDVQLFDQKEEIEKVTYLKDVVYATQDSVELKLQIMMPAPYQEKGKTYPCILFVRGSAWMKQNLYTDVPQLSRFARRGYVVAIVEYRHSGIAQWPAQRTDALAAVDFMRRNAAKYHVDPENLFVWGSSSGAHVALFTGLHMNNDSLPPVNGIIAYFPPTDVLRMKDDPTAATTGDENSPEGLLIGKVAVEDAPEKAKAASPYYYIADNKNMPPVFLAHGTKDRVVPFSQADLLANELQKQGVEYEFHALRNADHGSWQFWTDKMYDRVEAFIQKHLK